MDIVQFNSYAQCEYEHGKRNSSLVSIPINNILMVQLDNENSQDPTVLTITVARENYAYHLLTREYAVKVYNEIVMALNKSKPQIVYIKE